MSFPTIEDQNEIYVKANNSIKKISDSCMIGHLHLRHMKKIF